MGWYTKHLSYYITHAEHDKHGRTHLKCASVGLVLHKIPNEWHGIDRVHLSSLIIHGGERYITQEITYLFQHIHTHHTHTHTHEHTYFGGIYRYKINRSWNHSIYPLPFIHTSNHPGDMPANDASVWVASQLHCQQLIFVLRDTVWWLSSPAPTLFMAQ